MARRLIFSVKTPLGYRVSLSRDRWRQIVKYKHRSMAGHEKAVRGCLENPAIIHASDKDPDVHLYYVPSGKSHLCVVAAPGDHGDHFIVTAYFTRNIKKGTELWKN